MPRDSDPFFSCVLSGAQVRKTSTGTWTAFKAPGGRCVDVGFGSVRLRAVSRFSHFLAGSYVVVPAECTIKVVTLGWGGLSFGAKQAVVVSGPRRELALTPLGDRHSLWEALQRAGCRPI